MRTRPRRHAALLSLLATAALVAVVVATWTALRPAASERDPLPVPQPPAPEPADPGSKPGHGPADVVPPPPLPDDDADDDEDDGGDGDDGDDD